MITRKISFINESTVVDDANAQKVMASLQKQLNQDFSPLWGLDGALTFYKSGEEAPESDWQLIVLDNTDQAGALGYHDLTSSGLPLGKIFAGTDIQYNLKWSVTASHELLEMMADPDLNKTASREDQNGDSILYAYEICDPCEDDQFGYEVDGIAVSDFVLPAWFEQFAATGAQYDFRKLIKEPFQLLKGGYISINKGKGWTQIYGQYTELAYKLRPHVGSRRERRATPRSQWLRSIRRVKTA